MSRQPAQDFLLFLIGGALFAAGVFLFTNQVMVGTGLGSFGLGGGSGGGFGGGFGRGLGGWFGGVFSRGAGPGFGLLMLPFGIGVALLLADVYRRLGWFLLWASSAALAVAVLQSLLFSFRPTSLWSLLARVGLVAGGGGLMFKALGGYQREERVLREREAEDSRQSLEGLRRELEQLRQEIRREGQGE